MARSHTQHVMTVLKGPIKKKKLGMFVNVLQNDRLKNQKKNTPRPPFPWPNVFTMNGPRACFLSRWRVGDSRLPQPEPNLLEPQQTRSSSQQSLTAAVQRHGFQNSVAPLASVCMPKKVLSSRHRSIPLSPHCCGTKDLPISQRDLLLRRLKARPKHSCESLAYSCSSPDASRPHPR